MPELDINEAKSSDMESWAKTDVGELQTDGISEHGETEYTNPIWTKNWAIFNSQPELKSAILMKAIWNVGKGVTTKDSNTKLTLESMRGVGKDSFEDILFNMEVIRRVGRDSFAEIIRNDAGRLINLKPLDPGSIKIVFDDAGIKRYEQISKFTKKGIINRIKNAVGVKKVVPFEPEEIFHLTLNRLADQIHGISDIESLEPTILAELESFTDIKKVMHRQAKPFIIFKLKTDDEDKINKIVDKINRIREFGEDLFIPDDENILSFEVVQVNVSQIIMEWRNDIRNKFYRCIGLPQIIPGAGGQGTESETKVIYFAFEQIVERDQRYIEKQVWNQLALRINLIPPSTLAAQLQTDETKDGPQGVSQPTDIPQAQPQPAQPAPQPQGAQI
ncbi:hypothetical protein LCGC14_0774260 [marine sediment metagenome]|uniref:Uncharacterized protein n=1 Tax=marine sediment metagenome TaxID=412755 RepID=A0A0F9T4D6_9ZZZZ